jgi:hypothetical protein
MRRNEKLGRHCTAARHRYPCRCGTHGAGANAALQRLLEIWRREDEAFANAALRTRAAQTPDRPVPSAAFTGRRLNRSASLLREHLGLV